MENIHPFQLGRVFEKDNDFLFIEYYKYYKRRQTFHRINLVERQQMAKVGVVKTLFGEIKTPRKTTLL